MSAASLCYVQAQAPLLTCQNRIEIKSKNGKMIYAKRLSELEGRQDPCYKQPPLLPLRYLIEI